MKTPLFVVIFYPIIVPVSPNVRDNKSVNVDNDNGIQHDDNIDKNVKCFNIGNFEVSRIETHRTLIDDFKNRVDFCVTYNVDDRATVVVLVVQTDSNMTRDVENTDDFCYKQGWG